jgi:hypothetical protein
MSGLGLRGGSLIVGVYDFELHGIDTTFWRLYVWMMGEFCIFGYLV